MKARKIIGLAFFCLGCAISIFYAGYVIALRTYAPVIGEQQTIIVSLETDMFNLQNRYYELERAYNALLEKW